jgi:hypothetical protein
MFVNVHIRYLKALMQKATHIKDSYKNVKGYQNTWEAWWELKWMLRGAEMGSQQISSSRLLTDHLAKR